MPKTFYFTSVSDSQIIFSKKSCTNFGKWPVAMHFFCVFYCVFSVFCDFAFFCEFVGKMLTFLQNNRMEITDKQKKITKKQNANALADDSETFYQQKKIMYAV